MKVWEVVGIAFLIRILVISLSVFLENLSYLPNYTDIDYHIFSDASLLLLEGSSPFERDTFRYPPLLALLLIPNHLVIYDFGKVLFSLFDSLIPLLIEILHDPKTGVQDVWFQSCQSKFSVIWMVNVLSINICTRGSSDSIVNCGVLLMTVLTERQHWRACGVCLGFLIYWRLFPIIYVPLVFASMWKVMGHHSFYRFLHDSAVLSVTIVLSFLIFFVPSLFAYFPEYWEECWIYHFIRKDHRHNFSPYFYPFYLSLSSPLSYRLPFLSNICQYLCAFLPSIAWITLGSVWVQKYVRGKQSMGQCGLLLTWTFLLFNRVCTAQYFTWIVCWVPLAMTLKNSLTLNSSRIQDSLFNYVFSIFWNSWLIVPILLWLGVAYQIEFLRSSLYESLWAVSLLVWISGCYGLYRTSKYFESLTCSASLQLSSMKK